MFGIGGFELFLILLFGFLIFGPDKLPAMAKTLGRAIAKFRNAQDEMNKVIKEEKIFDPDAEDPFKNPLDALSKMGDAASSGAKEVTSSAAGAAKQAKSATSESFSERKARYDRERAARKEAEKKAAEEAAASEGASEKPQVKPEPSSASPESAKPTADELYGTKPQAKAADPAKVAATLAENESTTSKEGE